MVEISPYKIKFEYIKETKNTLADTMSHLIKIIPDTKPPPEPEGYEFGYYAFEELDPIKTTKSQEDMCDIQQQDEQPIPVDTKVEWGLSSEDIRKAQLIDKFCADMLRKLSQDKPMVNQAYHVENDILKKYVNDNKQRFNTIVVPLHYTLALLRSAHDELGHNGSARTYMLLRRLYYWRGMKPYIYRYVKQCRSCQQRNRQVVKYIQGQFKTPTTPMEFISMDLIGEFHPPSSKGHRYALTVICMLTGYTFCIPLKTKTAAEVVKAYIDNVYAKFGGSLKILSDNGTEFKNQLFTDVATELGVEYKIYTPPLSPTV